jgi:hypothetical protein
MKGPCTLFPFEDDVDSIEGLNEMGTEGGFGDGVE